MIKSVKVAPLKMSRNRFGHEFFRAINGIFQREPERKTTSNRRRIGAAGTVCCDSSDKRRRKLSQFALVKKYINRVIALKMATFQQDRGAILVRESFRRFPHLSALFDLCF